MKFSDIISDIMPFVKDGNSELPFIISRNGGKWEIDYINLPEDKIEDYFDSVREERDSCAVMYTGADFANGSFAFVYDKILKERIVLESDSWAIIDDNITQFIDNIDENIAHLSPEAAEHLTNLNYPLKWIMSICPPPLIQQIENKVADLSKQISETVPGTSFDKMIDKIRPEVAVSGNEPLIIYRDAGGNWHGDFTQNQYGETYEWVEDVMNSDKAAFIMRGRDFPNGEKQALCNDILCQRLRGEYYNLTCYDTAADHDKIYALLNFFEDKVNLFSPETLSCFTEFDRPLKFLEQMCPFNLETEYDGWLYNKSLAADAIDHIEQRVGDIINSQKDKTELKKQTQRDVPAAIESGEIPIEPKCVIDGHYVEKWSISLAGREVFLAVDEKDDEPYLVCTAKRDNPLGVTEYFGGEVTSDYIEAMRGFLDRVDELLVTLEKERAMLPTIPLTLTSADCVTGGLDEDLTGKVVVIKPEVLSPEYQTAEHQLKIVLGGFGASPNSRGNAVFCKDLYSGKESRFERYDVAGVADIEKIPQWAREKIAEQRGEELQSDKLPEVKTKPKPKPSLHDNIERNKARGGAANKPVRKRGENEH
ncbi:hypothetical protein FACS189499_05580 [Clostridia bacterium]|nr:hypothetical protein FACS189499_05580 [Clostridia bacterium]